jgi:hypothetical protein
MPSKFVALLVRAPGAFGVAELDQLLAAAIEEHILHFHRQLRPRRLDIKFVLPCERLDQLKIVGVPAIPAANRTARERQVRVADNALAIEEFLAAKAIAGGAGAAGIVEGK